MLVREGLLTLVTTVFAVGLVANLPLSLELAQWHSMPAKVVLATVAVLAVFGLSAALRTEGPAGATRP